MTDLTPADDHNLPVPTTARPEPLSFLDLSNGQVLAIDHWLKVNEFGLMSLGKSDGMVKAISAVLDMSEVRFSYQIKFGHPVRYRKTYDRAWSTEQKPWADEVAEAVRLDPRASPMSSPGQATRDDGGDGERRCDLPDHHRQRHEYAEVEQDDVVGEKRGQEDRDDDRFHEHHGRDDPELEQQKEHRDGAPVEIGLGDKPEIALGMPRMASVEPRATTGSQ